MTSTGNRFANAIWEANLPQQRRLTPNCSRDEKERFIRAKYVTKDFLASLPSSEPVTDVSGCVNCPSDWSTESWLIDRSVDWSISMFRLNWFIYFNVLMRLIWIDFINRLIDWYYGFDWDDWFIDWLIDW